MAKTRAGGVVCLRWKLLMSGRLMTMTPELEILDQLSGGDLPLNVIANLFADRDHCRRAVGALLVSGDVCIVDSADKSVPLWRFRELEDVAAFWAEGAPYRISITDAGAERVR